MICIALIDMDWYGESGSGKSPPGHIFKYEISNLD